MPLDVLPGDELSTAKRELAEATIALRQSIPDRQLGAAKRLAVLLVEAGRRQRGWGEVKLRAMRALGQWYAANKRPQGRPRKTSDSEVLSPTAAELGLSPQDAQRIQILGQIADRVFEEYLRHSDAPSYTGCLEFSGLSDGPDLGNAGLEDERRSRFVKVAARSFAIVQCQAPGPNTSFERYTPSELFDAMDVVFDCDVCSPGPEVTPWIPARRHYTIEDDGLSQSWHKWFVWMNCPFGIRNGTLDWIDKFIEHGNGVALFPDFTSTEWWHDLAENCDCTLFVKPRIQFEPRLPNGHNALGSTLFAIGAQGTTALRNAERNGRGVLLLRRC